MQSLLSYWIDIKFRDCGNSNAVSCFTPGKHAGPTCHAMGALQRGPLKACSHLSTHQRLQPHALPQACSN